MSKDNNTIFTTCLDNWAMYPRLPTLGLDGFLILADRVHEDSIVLPGGRRVSMTLDAGNNPGFENNVIAETVDGKRKLVRFYSGCIAYYEQNVLKALLCERVESQIEYDVLIKILKARGDLPIICSSYEY